MSDGQHPRRSHTLARGVAVGAALAALLLLVAAPTPAAALAQLRDAGAGSGVADPTGPLVALLALLAWALTGWLAVAVLVTAGSHLPGLLGRLAGAVAHRLAPVALRRAVEVALGLSVAVGVVGVSPAAATPAPPGAPAVTSLDPAVAPTLDRPSAAGREVPAPALDWPTPPDADAPQPAAPERSSAPGPSALATTWATTGRDEVVVQPGDSLWAIAEQDLATRGAAPTDADIARTWPSWWAANRDAIGADPDLILPGIPLTPPPADGTASS